MAKRKNIKGLPNSLVQRYFSTLFWWDKAYMADWICNASSEKQITSLEIDILNQTVFPTDLQIKPIVGHLPKLKETIEKTLESNGFQNNYITTAKFKHDRFDRIKKTFLEKLDNELQESPYQQTMRYTAIALTKNLFSPQDIKEALETISLEQLNRFIKAIYSRCSLLIFVHGNYTTQQAQTQPLRRW